MKPIITTVFILFAAVASVSAQVQTQYPDETLPHSYDPLVVLEDWKVWAAEPTEQNAYVGAFMKKYEVPQKGMYGLGLHETWYWWISNHEEKIESYLKQKEEHEAAKLED